MLEKLKANILFHSLLKRPNIDKAYKMVPPTDSWYDTIMTVHNSLAEMKKLPHEEWKIKSHDGLTLRALYYPCGESRKTLIWIHGYTSHAERESAYPGLFYHSLGFNVLIPYLRAHGPSEGKYITFGALEHRDMMRWVDQVNAFHPQGSIVLHGLSMGGGIALDMATQKMENVKGFVVDAPSYSIEEFIRGVSGSVFKKEGPQVAQWFIKRFQREFAADPLAFNRIENIKNGRYPLLLSAGSMENMEELLGRIQQNNPMDTQIVILAGCNHGNGMYKQTKMYQDAIQAFIDTAIAR